MRVDFLVRLHALSSRKEKDQESPLQRILAAWSVLVQHCKFAVLWLTVLDWKVLADVLKHLQRSGGYFKYRLFNLQERYQTRMGGSCEQIWRQMGSHDAYRRRYGGRMRKGMAQSAPYADWRPMGIRSAKGHQRSCLFNPRQTSEAIPLAQCGRWWEYLANSQNWLKNEGNLQVG